MSSELKILLWIYITTVNIFNDIIKDKEVRIVINCAVVSLNHIKKLYFKIVKN